MYVAKTERKTETMKKETSWQYALKCDLFKYK